MKKRQKVGNAAAMREALEYVLQFDATDEAAEQDGLTDAERIAEYADHISECQKKARAALSEPARQCDVGTPEELGMRYKAFCRKHFTPDQLGGNCRKCTLKDRRGWSCQLAWAQTPYEAQEGGAE